MTSRPAFRRMLLFCSKDEMYSVVTKAILRLGDDRLRDVLQMEMSVISDAQREAEQQQAIPG
jgi:DNA invertase Pin-like site-specific DNA recombinase